MPCDSCRPCVDSVLPFYAVEEKCGAERGGDAVAEEGAGGDALRESLALDEWGSRRRKKNAQSRRGEGP